MSHTVGVLRALELILEDGSGDETEVDHYVSSGESVQEEDFVDDIPENNGHLHDDSEISEGEQMTVDAPARPRVHVAGVGDGDANPVNLFDDDFQLEDDNDELYDADTEVEDDDESEEDDDFASWGRNLRNFPQIPDFSPAPKQGLQDHVFNGIDDPKALDAYSVFFTNDLVQRIQRETNQYARDAIEQKQRQNGGTLPPKSAWARWKPVTIPDMRNFFACCIHMGIVKKPRMSDYWSRHPALHASYCSQLMSRNRFMDILSFLHMNDNTTSVPFGEEGHDPIHKIRPLVTHLNTKFQETYIPDKTICVDEAMCPFKGRSKFRVYMKDKPTKWGFKFYELCDSSTGYVFHFEMFCADRRLSNKPYDVVMRLMVPLMDKGYQLFIDNYYCCPKVCEDLSARGTMVCGTVRRNRVGLPKEMCAADVNLEKGAIDYRRKGSVVVCRWKDKKDVFMLSTMHRPSLRMIQARYELKRKPLAVIDYISNMAGVDHSDQLISYFPMHRKSVKWWKKPFFHLMTMIMIQAMIILNAHRKQKRRAKKCLEDVVKDVLTQLPVVDEIPIAHVAVGDKLRLTGRHFAAAIPATTLAKPYKNCKVCYAKSRARGVNATLAKSQRKRTRFWCRECAVALCVEPCFEVWHTKKDVLHA
ncbi:piggyBac transposable element-derived protein 4-like [Littorina saxatilis]|uniref:PiggyBac transposable element-derived protein domain-containing protein n=1 Tax=Littorina saxatilis TaxID=31220 RepID=A0AAN9G6S8_9CAEN